MLKKSFSLNWPHLLNEPSVRDLAWILFSPSLLDEKSTLDIMQDSFFGLDKAQVDAFITHLKKLDQNPAPLLNYLQETSFKRLGDYFEALIWYWLSQTPNCHKLERHIVIQQSRQTLGELDFLFFSEALGRTVHWEVSVKFFLLHGDKEDFASYLGPNPEDSLETKIATLKRQLLLCHKPEVRRFLEQQFLLPLESQCLVRGYVFYPVQKDGSNMKEASEGLNKKHLSGWWDHIGSNNWKIKAKQQNNSRFMILPKLSWLAPAVCEAEDREKTKNLLSFDELCILLNQEKGNTMVATLSLEDEHWYETERGIIVQDSWPKLAKNEPFAKMKAT
jgi:uncharacterized protein